MKVEGSSSLLGVLGRTYTPVFHYTKISLLLPACLLDLGDILHGGYMNLRGFVDCPFPLCSLF
jgi:hypothetical protein